ALPVFERAVAVDPTRGQAHYWVGAAYRRLRRLPEAVAATERWFAIGLPQDYPDSLMQLCDLYRETAAFARAEACFKRVLALDPSNVAAQRAVLDVQNNLNPARPER